MQSSHLSARRAQTSQTLSPSRRFLVEAEHFPQLKALRGKRVKRVGDQVHGVDNCPCLDIAVFRLHSQLMITHVFPFHQGESARVPRIYAVVSDGRSDFPSPSWLPGDLRQISPGLG